MIKYRRYSVFVTHVVLAIFANYMAFSIRFEGVIPKDNILLFLNFLPLLLLIRSSLYFFDGLYKDLWRYSSINDLVKIIRSTTFGSIIFAILVRFVMGSSAYPRSVFVIDWLLMIMISGGARFCIRVFNDYLKSDKRGKRLLIVGAGDAGEILARDIKNNHSTNYMPVGFIDDNPTKKGLEIHGIPILGPREAIPQAISSLSVEEILICMPSVDKRVLKDIYELCKPSNLPITTIPSMPDIISGNVTISNIKPLELEDLLQRDSVETDINYVRSLIEGRPVLVTGAGGTIGSELCRQILSYNPSHLILFDRYENGLFDIDRELYVKKGDTFIKTVVGDMRDRRCVEHLFKKHRPKVVFHAAAHKHVPLMEFNPVEAVANNIFGTKNVLECAGQWGVEEFVTISTDKAVNPMNVMGATKRIVEFMTQCMNSIYRTNYVIVRFGNVLGSNGSVVPVFKEQIKHGGPVTVTHPDIRRFFMLTSEAVHLVLAAAGLGNGGEIFVLDMGEQIKILDLAENLIRLRGLVPHEDIAITFTGLRPGEKLFEELFDETERVFPSQHTKLRVAISDAIPTYDDLAFHLLILEGMVRRSADDEIIAELKNIVPGFKELHADRQHTNVQQLIYT